MPRTDDERTPLLQFPGSFPVEIRESENMGDCYKQFCDLIGNRPADLPPNAPWHPAKDTLYYRATHHRYRQGQMYQFTAALTNTLILSQVVLGAALTGLGASSSSHIVITVFGALNTIIAGLVAFLKSRGQPMRARMFRDDLDRVVDEIENSAIMWRGISEHVHGYDDIDTDNSVTVRSEVARLTRLYDRAVKTSSMNDPDSYGAAISQDHASSGLRSHTGQTLLPAMPASMPAAPAPGGGVANEPIAIPGPSIDPDESPATKAPVQKNGDDKKNGNGKADGANSGDDKQKDGDSKKIEDAKPSDSALSLVPTPPPPPANPDEQPATSATPAKPKEEQKEGDTGEGAAKGS